MPKIQTPALCTVKVSNEELKYSVNSVDLRQYIDNHHVLKVYLRQDIIGDDKIGDPEPYADFLGKSISVGIEPTGGKVDASSALEFIGVVTEVRFENSVDEVNILVITAMSPTISMDGAKKNSFSFDQTASDIAGGILKDYPITLGTVDSTSETMRFSVQYRETDYEYVMRLAAGAGKFAFYDGKEFRFVSASSADEHELKWRELLGSFSLGLGTVSANFSASVYNYEEDNTFMQDTTSLSSKTSLSSLSKKSPEASEEIFPKSGYSNDARIAEDAQALDDLLINEKSRAMGQMINCHGHSIVPNVAVGHCVKITGMDSFNQQFWVTEVIHIFDKTGKYHNEFKCSPLDIAYPTNRARPAKTHTKIQTAKVVDNVDPDGMGRIKVKFPWNESDETVWVRYVSIHAGNDRGFFCLPEIDDEVLVAFVEGDPDRPIVIGSLYNKTQTPPAEAADNNPNKIFKTKSGNQIVFSDEDGSEKIEISHGDGKNSIVLDISGPSISITSDGGDITLEGNNITLKTDSGITLDAGGEAKINAAGNMSIKASGNQTIEGSGTVDIKGSTINLN
ncbi:MAG TPA: type VI secretion system tip protein VgrG [candidate division Zixibacteria bacterium]|nr:type VI secretion system tip protein VgrG [candidate division Zixibacteria bacterium]